jgi:hypothetical protein
MTTTNIILLGIFIIESIRLIISIVDKVKDDKEKIPFSKRLKKDYYA